MMDAAGVDSIGLKASGNKAPMDFRMRPFYSANIASSWPDERKEEAFDFLKSKNAEDLIKTKIEANLPKGNLDLAKQLIEEAKRLEIPTKLSLSVHSQTLTAWLRELVEKHNTVLSVSELEKIGGTIGRIVKPETRE